MSAQELFNRAWKVTIGIPGDTGYSFDSLKTVFSIEKTSAESSNKAKIALYGLSSISIQTFQKKGLQIRLDAGYTGLVETLYLGDVVRVHTERKNDGILTSFECGDGEKALTLTHFDRSYPEGTKYVTVFQDVAVALGVEIGTVIGIKNQTFNKGFSVSGPCRKILTDLCANQLLEWSVQNGYLQIIPLGSHNGEEAIVLSKQTGLIGVPSQKESGIEFDALLNPRLMPGQAVQLISENISGYFKIRKSTFEGDSHGQKWGPKCEAVAINATQTLPINQGNRFITIGTVA